MGMFYEGYAESRRKVLEMDEGELLSLLDGLYGRDNLEPGYSQEELRAEALSQHEREWTDTSSAQYEQVNFWKRVMKAQKDGYR